MCTYSAVSDRIRNIEDLVRLRVVEDVPTKFDEWISMA